MNKSDFTKNAIEAAIRLGLLLLLAFWCFDIVKPFILPVMWGVIIAVAIYPLFVKFKSVLGERNKLASVIYTLVALTLLITPMVMVSNSIIDTSAEITERYEAGKLEIPPPPDDVKEWPFVGESMHTVWSESSTNLDKTLIKYKSQLKNFSEKFISAVAGFAGGILQFVLSVIISGVLLANALPAYGFTIKLFIRLTNTEHGQEYADFALPEFEARPTVEQ